VDDDGDDLAGALFSGFGAVAQVVDDGALEGGGADHEDADRLAVVHGAQVEDDAACRELARGLASQDSMASTMG